MRKKYSSFLLSCILTLPLIPPQLDAAVGRDRPYCGTKQHRLNVAGEGIGHHRTPEDCGGDEHKVVSPNSAVNEVVLPDQDPDVVHPKPDRRQGGKAGQHKQETLFVEERFPKTSQRVNFDAVHFAPPIDTTNGRFQSAKINID